jgi:hypothetical protein
MHFPCYNLYCLLQIEWNAIYDHIPTRLGPDIRFHSLAVFIQGIASSTIRFNCSFH